MADEILFSGVINQTLVSRGSAETPRVNIDPECCADVIYFICGLVFFFHSPLYFNDDKSYQIKFRLSGSHILPHTYLQPVGFGHMMKPVVVNT